jgi:hypothetical protein
MSILLAMALGLSTILVSQIKMIRGMEKSVIAFYAADTGIEKALTERAASPTPYPNAPYVGALNLDGDAIEGLSGNNCPDDLKDPDDVCYYVEVLDSSNPDCNALNYCLKSKGVYKDTQRAIEVNY